MELINFNIVKDNNGTEYIKRIERDTRPVVDRLYNINIPAYPYTLDNIGVEIVEQEIVSSEMLLNVSSDIGNTIYHTSESFHEQLSTLYPYLSEAEHKKKHSELMKRYVYGVLGENRSSVMLSPEREALLCSERGFEYDFVKYHAFMLKGNTTVIEALMLDNAIYPMAQGFSLTTDGRMYLLDSVNDETALCADESIMDITEEVYRLFRTYEVIPSNKLSLGEWLKDYKYDIEKARRIVQDALARILWGYTDNDAVQVNIVKSASEVVLERARKLAERISAQQKNAQNATGADF